MLMVFFKQKTAYEMRMSDWSSDVCSSDLHVFAANDDGEHNPWRLVCPFCFDPTRRSRLRNPNLLHPCLHRRDHPCQCAIHPAMPSVAERSEERRVGKECVGQCRSRGSPSP